jgi:hypothetical protein
MLIGSSLLRRAIARGITPCKNQGKPVTETVTCTERSGHWPAGERAAMLRAMRLSMLLLALACVACTDADPSPPSRELMFDATIDDSGLSEELSFAIPEHTRSVTVVAEGAPDALLALGTFALGDGADLVQLPGDPHGPAMEESYQQEQIGHMPGQLYQSIRLGTFTHVYPYKPGQLVVAGTGRIRIAANRSGPVKVRIVMPEDIAATVLPLNVYIVSDTLADPITDPFREELQQIFTRAGITIRIDRIERLAATPFARITDFNEPQESPTSQSAMIPSLVVDRASEGLDVFLVERLPSGVAGLSLGTPGPPIRGSYYFGVVIRGDYPAFELARVMAHEVSHFLALQHLQNRGVSGQLYPDPIDDTTPGADNLMENGTALSAGQTFALTRSALLIP